MSIMPSYLKYGLHQEKLSIKVSPTELIRKLIPQVPYRTGGNATLTLKINSPQTVELEYEWRLLSTSKGVKEKLGKGTFTPNTKKSTIKLPHLLWSGEYVLSLRIPKFSEEFQDIVTFDVLSRDAMFMQLVYLLAGVCLGFLLAKIFS